VLTIGRRNERALRGHAAIVAVNSIGEPAIYPVNHIEFPRSEAIASRETSAVDQDVTISINAMRFLTTISLAVLEMRNYMYHKRETMCHDNPRRRNVRYAETTLAIYQFS